MKKYNIGILAHVDAGKTSLTEQLLLKCGEIRNPGSVDEGTAASDFMDVERKRGISVKNACLTMHYKEAVIHVIDTPGHMDFAGEVVRSLYAVDGVVLVISAAEGVQAQTLSIFHELKTHRIPVVFAVNKVDRVGFDEEALLLDIRKELDPHVIPLQTVKEPGTDGAYTEALSPEREIFEGLMDVDSDLEETFLMEETPDPETVLRKLALHTKNAEVYPLVYTCAKTGLGIEGLLDAVTELLPECRERETEALSGIVFQVRHEKGRGKAAYIRLFGGKLKSRDTVPILGLDPEEREKITQIRFMQGSRSSDENEITAGDIAAVYGLSRVRTGDLITESSELTDRQRSFSDALAKPLLMTKVTPVKPEEETALDEALTELSDEDPLLQYERNLMTHEMHLHIMGEIQIEILKDILENRFHLETEFSRPGVIFKETPGSVCIGHEAYTMPKPCWAILDLKIEPTAPGSGLTFSSEVHESQLAIKYQNHVETSVFKTLAQGVYGWEVTDAHVTLVAGNSHQWHTHPLDFFVAAPIAVLRALRDSGSVLLEPYMDVRLSAEASLLGKVSGQVLKMRGSFDTPLMENDRFTMNALIPLRDCMDYPVTFRSLTSGRGLISMTLNSYRPCEKGFMETLERRSVDPLDRAKWILSCRSAMGDGERW